MLPRALAAALLFATLSSCAVERVYTAVDPRLDAGAGHARPSRVIAYTTVDGRTHAFNGEMRVLGDSLIFEHAWTPATSLTAAAHEGPVVLARGQVSSVRLIKGIDVPRSILLALFAAAFVGAALFASALGGFPGGV